MFNRTYVINPDNSGAIREVAASNRKMAETISQTSQDEIQARDRVDITLREYESMKSRIANLESENNWFKTVLGKIEFPLVSCLSENFVVPKNIQVSWSDSIDFFNMKRRYHILFEIAEEDLRRVGIK